MKLNFHNTNVAIVDLIDKNIENNQTERKLVS